MEDKIYVPMTKEEYLEWIDKDKKKPLTNFEIIDAIIGRFYDENEGLKKEGNIYTNNGIPLTLVAENKVSQIQVSFIGVDAEKVEEMLNNGQGFKRNV